MSKDTRHRSRQEIMHFILQLSVGTRRPGDQWKAQDTYVHCPFISTVFSDEIPPIGALVILTSAPSSKYQIGWFREFRFHPDRQYLIESLEDGDRCWWGNVGINYMDPEKTKEHPEWQWTDRQWKFKEKWFRFCWKIKGADWHRPFFPEFGSGYSVTIGLRTKFSDQPWSKRTFPDWRKITREMMDKCFDECSKEQSEPAKNLERINAEDAVLAATVAASAPAQKG